VMSWPGKAGTRVNIDWKSGCSWYTGEHEQRIVAAVTHVIAVQVTSALQIQACLGVTPCRLQHILPILGVQEDYSLTGWFDKGDEDTFRIHCQSIRHTCEKT
jgi:hypothetical protein